jgi:flagellar hook-basal body complex protein FliE
MSISPIAGIAGFGGVPGAANVSALGGLAGVTGASPTGVTGDVSPASFLDVTKSIDSLQALQANATALGVKAVTGDLDDVHDYTIASSQASVALELTVAMRNKAVEAFTEIMRMQA